MAYGRSELWRGSQLIRVDDTITTNRRDTPQTNIAAVDGKGERHAFSSALEGWREARQKMEKAAEEKIELQVLLHRKAHAARLVLQMVLSLQQLAMCHSLHRWELLVHRRRLVRVHELLDRQVRIHRCSPVQLTGVM